MSLSQQQMIAQLYHSALQNWPIGPDLTVPSDPYAVEFPPPLNEAELSETLVVEFLHAIKERPTDFIKNEHTIVDRKTSHHWWIANGISHWGLYGPIKYGMFTDEQKKRCWLACLGLASGERSRRRPRVRV